jgi:hypothetical protein
MTRTQRAAAGKGLAVVAFLFLWTALMLSGEHRLGGAMMLLTFGMVFFCVGGGATLPLREITIAGWVFIAIGFAFLALAAVWAIIYKQPWIVHLLEIIAGIGALLAATSVAIYLRATRGADH